MAQQPDRRHDGKKGERHKEITEMVSDLSSQQRKRLDAITDASKEKVSALRIRQKAVRDSITMYMEREGDQSRILYPLFEREAQLQCAISREMYATKVKIDELLTPEQRRQVRDACRKPEAKHPKKKK